MSFVVTLLVLLIERFFDWSHIRQWNWYLSFQNLMSQHLKGKDSALILAASIAPIAFVILFLSYGLHQILYGLGKFILDFVILLYCLGPRNFWAEVVANSPSVEDPIAHSVDKMLIAANTRVFAVIIWYFILGPMGAFIYRAIDISAKNPSEVSHKAQAAKAILDWLPVRIMTLIFAAGSHFNKVFACWRQRLPSGLESNDLLLIDCGRAALGIDSQDVADRVNKAAVSLIDRSLVILLVIVAFIILLSY